MNTLIKVLSKYHIVAWILLSIVLFAPEFGNRGKAVGLLCIVGLAAYATVAAKGVKHE
jgi:hypothetical protein